MCFHRFSNIDKLIENIYMNHRHFAALFQARTFVTFSSFFCHIKLKFVQIDYFLLIIFFIILIMTSINKFTFCYTKIHVA